MNITEAELWAAYQKDRSVENRNRLVEFHLYLAKQLAGRMAGRVPRQSIWDADSLFAEACVGLMRSVEGFDVDRGLAFSTYASQRINGAMIDAIRTDDFVPRLERAESKRDGRHVAVIGQMSALDQFDGVNTKRYADSIPSRPAEVDHSDWLDHPIADPLNSRERYMFDRRYREDAAFPEIAEELCVSPSRISQMHQKAIEKVRDRFHEDVPRSSVTRCRKPDPPLGEKPADTWPTCDHRELMDRFMPDAPEKDDVAVRPPTRLKDIERAAILDAMNRHGNCRYKVAAELDVSLRKLTNKLREYGVPRYGKVQSCTRTA